MIFLCQNSDEYDYDIRAIALAFFEREKIIACTLSEWETCRKTVKEEVDGAYDTVRDVAASRLFLRIIYREKAIEGFLTDEKGREAANALYGEYEDHKRSRGKVGRFLYELFSDFTGRTLPWGMLTGVRPTKIIMGWMEEETDPDSLSRRFRDTYLTTEQKAQLCVQVAGREKRILDAHKYEKEYSLYIGIPFCPTTCLYCSFASYPIDEFGDRMDAYLDALFKELRYVAEHCGNKALTGVYVGGGTPTALTEDALVRLMEEIHRLFPMDEAKEFTVEAGRPDSITREKLRILKRAGVGRISINPQTMHQETLDLIGRNHTVEQTMNAFFLAREEGFDNINTDIITGLPGEDVSHIYGTLSRMGKLRPESLTVHSLAIKRAAHLNRDMEKYRSLIRGSTDEMLRAVDENCRGRGMLPYYMYRQKNIPGNLENIGYSLPGKECLYNMLIMEEKQDILSCGAGASSKYVYPEENRIERTENVKNVDQYISRVDEMIDRKRKVLEFRNDCAG